MRHLLGGRRRPMVAREGSMGGGDRSIGWLDRGSRNESRDLETEPKAGRLHSPVGRWRAGATCASEEEEESSLLGSDAEEGSWRQ